MNFSLAIKFNRFGIHQCKTVAAFSFVPSIFDCSCSYVGLLRTVVMRERFHMSATVIVLEFPKHPCNCRQNVWLAAGDKPAYQFNN